MPLLGLREGGRVGGRASAEHSFHSSVSVQYLLGPGFYPQHHKDNEQNVNCWEDSFLVGASRTEAHHSGDSSSYIALLLHGKEAGSTFPHHRLSCKHTALKKLTLLLAALLQGTHLTDSI